MAPSYNPDEIMNAIQRADYGFVLENAMPHALAGNPDAQCTIALMYECGFGIQRDFLEAERWLLKATQQNSALAWNNLGTLYERRRFLAVLGQWILFPLINFRTNVKGSGSPVVYSAPLNGRLEPRWL